MGQIESSGELGAPNFIITAGESGCSIIIP
jgi:hypothetical protein